MRLINTIGEKKYPFSKTYYETLFSKYISSLNEDFKGLSFLIGNTIQTIVNNLPAEYQAVDYIETTGTQYINTGVKTTVPIEIETEMSFTNVSSRQLTGSESFYFGINASGYFEIYTASTIQAVENQFYKINSQYTTSAKKLFIDNAEVLSIDGTFSSNDKYQYLGGIGTGATSYLTLMCKSRFKYYKIYSNNILVRNFVPCYRKSDNVVGFYDLVNSEFYTNNGTGTFSYGKAIELIESPITSVTGNKSIKISGINLFNNNNVQRVNSSTLEITSTGFNITRTQSAGYGDQFIASYTITGLKPNTIYTFNLDVESQNTFNNLSIYVYKDNLFGTTLTKSNYEENGSNRKWNITTSDNGKIVIGFYGVTSSAGKVFKFTNIQLEEGTTKSNFQNYFASQTFLLHLGNETYDKIGNHQDRIYYQRGWKKESKVGNIIFNGTENWEDFSYTSGDNNFSCQNNTAISNILVPPSNPAELICNYFTAIELANAIDKSVVGIAQNSSNAGTIVISAPISALENENLSSWKDWLQENNTQLKYVLNHSVSTAITDNTLVEELNTLGTFVKDLESSNIQYLLEVV